MRSDVGIVTACHESDYFMAKATCASIRHFMPDVPICVIVDGAFQIAELERLYGAIPLYLNGLKDNRLRRLCPGSTKAKLAAIWEGPFEKFLYLDSDAIVWGDVLSHLNWDSTDFIILADPGHADPGRGSISHFFFDVELLQKVDRDFAWRQRPYFCAGAFAMRQSAIALDRYYAVEEIVAKEPNLFKFWDQGILNYLVFHESDQGRLRYSVQNLQHIPVDHPLEKTRKLLRTSVHKLPVSVNSPCVVHFCGPKPLMQNSILYKNCVFRPYTAFRLAHHQSCVGRGSIGYMLAWARVLREEWKILRPRLRRLLARKTRWF